MYTVEKCHNSVLGGPINFLLWGWHEDDPQLVGHKMATGPRNLHFMAEYLKKYKAYTLKIRQMYWARTSGQVTQFCEKYVKGQGHTGI